MYTCTIILFYNCGHFRTIAKRNILLYYSRAVAMFYELQSFIYGYFVDTVVEGKQ